jgi:hypothetical protein
MIEASGPRMFETQLQMIDGSVSGNFKVLFYTTWSPIEGLKIHPKS